MGKVKIDPADRAFSMWVRTRDQWTCQRCRKRYEPPTAALHCSHFQGRGKESTRFSPDNAVALCYGCHQYFTSHPADHYQWQLQRMGQKKLDELVLASNMYQKKDRKAELMYWRKRLEEDFNIVYKGGTYAEK